MTIPHRHGQERADKARYDPEARGIGLLEPFWLYSHPRLAVSRPDFTVFGFLF
jgi:hypothetical protein